MLKSIELQNFRNYPDKKVQLTDSVTIITGKNAIGKTNILEAIFVALFTKSFRANERQILLYEKDFFRVQLNFTKEELIYYYSISPVQKKILKLNSKPISLKKSIGKFPVVLFEPNSILLFSHTPSMRRKYLDTLLYQLDQNYVLHSITYKKTLRQRNAWLKSKKKQGIKAELNEQIYIYNIQLATSGAYITGKRKELLTEINPLIETYYNQISAEKKHIQINFENSNNSEEDLLKKIEDNWNVDRVVGMTLVGPHREDFSVLFNTQEVKNNASRGEVRSLLLAFKFAELHLFKEKSQTSPILLLDDVFSELDDSRQKLLIQNTSEFQTVITSTNIPPNIIKTFQHIEL